MSGMLSIGCNRKLGRRIGILNLPHGVTCPGKTALCEAVCYAAKANRYPAAKDKRVHNLAATLRDDFPEALALEIKGLQLGQVRLHEAGDVYDQVYLGKLYKVMHGLPLVSFLMYTKSGHLDWSGKPSNLARYWSMDKTSPYICPPGPIAYLVSKGESPPAGHVTCTHTQEKHYCGTECMICWQGQQDVYFKQH
jgi:hypothetical protein